MELLAIIVFGCIILKVLDDLHKDAKKLKPHVHLKRTRP